MAFQGENTPKKVTIYDTTLRDGEQTPGVAFSAEARVRIAKALDDFGVPQIEAGFAASSKAHAEDIRRVCELGLNADILSLSRPIKADIDAAIEAGVDGIILFIGISDIHLKNKLGKTFAEAARQMEDAIKYAKDKGVFVQASAEDGTRAAIPYLTEYVSRVTEAGADRIGIADTVGIATPEKMKAVVTAMRSATSLPISAHCHDDFGMAVANSLAAVEAGAEALSTTINGIGERAGNASTEQCAAALEFLYGIDTGMNLERAVETAKLVANLSGIELQPNRPIVGGNCFRHESGIHVAAILRDPHCYEPMDPEAVGATREIVLGKTSGRAAVRLLANEIGETDLSDEECGMLLQKVKVTAEAGQPCTPGMLRMLIAEMRNEGKDGTNA